MKRRFVLIDPSIKSLGGHHYEYAERVLRAARERGMEGVLVTHKDCDARLVHSCSIRPALSRTFWGNYQFYFVAPSLDRRWISFRRLKSLLPRWCSVAHLRDRLKFSWSGLCVARARDMSLTQIVTRPCLIEAVGAVPANRATLICASIALRVWLCLWLCASTVWRLSDRVGLVGLIKVVAKVPAYLIGLLLILPCLLRSRERPDEVFATEMEAALRDIDWSQQDVIFVPNATPAEMAGYVKLAHKSVSLTNAEWAFLFRRPIFEGHVSSYAQQSEAKRLHRLFFASLLKAVPNAKVSFYTDTDELTVQYNRLGQYKFRTVPVPVDWTEGQTLQESPSDVLTIGYLGDARDEKGFGLLPQVIEDFWLSRESERPVRFLIQANFNTPRGEPESRIAKELLKQYPASFVELVEGPFTSARYNSLLSRINIMLVPYKADAYIARSSGVFAEALAAGIPAVVPTTTWMASLGDKIRHERLSCYLHNTTPSSRVINSVRAEYKMIANQLLRWGSACTHIFIQLQYDCKEDFFVRVVVSLNDKWGLPVRVLRDCVKTISGVAIIPCSVEDASVVSFVAGPVDPQCIVGRCEVTLSALEISEDIALQSSIVTYDDQSHLAPKLRDVVTKYSVYRRLAEEAKPGLDHVYSPRHLVDMVSCGRADEDKRIHACVSEQSQVYV